MANVAVVAKVGLGVEGSEDGLLWKPRGEARKSLCQIEKYDEGFAEVCCSVVGVGWWCLWLNELEVMRGSEGLWTILECRRVLMIVQVQVQVEEFRYIVSAGITSHLHLSRERQTIDW